MTEICAPPAGAPPICGERYGVQSTICQRFRGHPGDHDDGVGQWPQEESPAPSMPPVGRLLAALGVDPATATDDEPRVQFVGDSVFVKYTGLIRTTPAEFARAAAAYLPEGWKPA